MVLINRLSSTFIYIFSVCFPVSQCQGIRYPVCSFEGPISSRKCRRCSVFSLNCTRDLIKIDIAYEIKTLHRECDNKDECDKCCVKPTYRISSVKKYVADRCDQNSYCRIEPPHTEHSYNVYYKCMPNPSTQQSATTPPTPTKPISTTIKPSSKKTTLIKKSAAKTTLAQPSTATKTSTTNAKNITGTKEIPTTAVVLPVILFFVLILVIIAVVCFTKKWRQKKDETRGGNSQISSKTAKLVSNCVYTSDVSDDVVTKHSQSVKRTLPSTEDGAYAECKNVENVDNDNGGYYTVETDADNGEYNTIEINQTTLKFDPAYSHLPNQIHTRVADNTYSHITTEQNNPPATSAYSHLNVESMQSTTEDNDATYNTLQTNDINRTQKRQPAYVDESENVYNIANFSSTSSTQQDNDTEYSHLNLTNKNRTDAISTPTKTKVLML